MDILKYALLLSWLFAYTFGHAQAIVDLGNIDLIGYCKSDSQCTIFSGYYEIGQIAFLKKEANRTYTRYTIHFDIGQGTGAIIDTIKDVDKEKDLSGYAFIPISDIRFQSLQKLKQSFSEFQYVSNEQNEEGNDMITRSLFPLNNFLLAFHYKKSEKQGNGHFIVANENSNLENFLVIKLHPNIFILYSFDHLVYQNRNEGMVVLDPIEEKERIFVKKRKADVVKGINKAELFEGSELSYNRISVADTLYKWTDGYGYCILKDTFTEIGFDGKFVVGEKKEGYYIYNCEGIQLNKAPVKAYHIMETNAIAMLADNEVKVTDLEGKDIHLVFDPTNFRQFSLSETSNIIGEGNTVLLTRGQFGGDKQRVLTLEMDSLPPDSKLFFPDNSKRQYNDGSFEPKLLVLLSEGTYKLVAVKNWNAWNKEGLKADSVVENGFFKRNIYHSVAEWSFVSSQSFDSVKLWEVPSEVNRSQENALLLYKRNAIGIYNMAASPTLPELKYSRLEKPVCGFIRFMLTNGRSGWLDWFNGVEYYDE